jgi:DNA (cytosine-5)-methyltransferase 1
MSMIRTSLRDEVRERKIERLRRGGVPRVLDLFSGCGGLSLGFRAAEFSIVGAVEVDPLAAASHARNFHGTRSEKERNVHSLPRDITVSEPKQIVEEFELGPVGEAVDVIVGGPPCQSFARVGRAKLREVAEHPEAFLKDPRSNLYIRYLHYVKMLHPLVLVMENVPDVLNYGGHNIAEEVCETLTPMGYECRYTLLNSAYYGVPQMRERMFLVAYAEELGAEVNFPQPTHWVELPKGYESSRQVALKYMQTGLFNGFYQKPPEANPGLERAVTAREALEDLPRITLHLEGKLKRGARRFDEKWPYREDVTPSEFATRMRNWPGFEGNGGVVDHVIRSLPRDYDIFRRMNPGDQYPEAHRHAMQLFEERLKQLARKGKQVRPGTAEYKALKKKIVPPYDAKKFPNKWRKMESDQPARTLMAHLGKDGYSHIHYDSGQARTISVREAARLQSFPDGFMFEGTMNPAFRQIGNAVPPLMAKAIADEIMGRFRRLI